MRPPGAPLSVRRRVSRYRGRTISLSPEPVVLHGRAEGLLEEGSRPVSADAGGPRGDLEEPADLLPLEPAQVVEDDEGEDDSDEEEDMDDGSDPAMPAPLDHRLVDDEEDLETPRQVGLPGTKARSLALLSSAFAHEAAESGARLLTKLYGRDVGQPHLERAWLSLLGRRPTAAELEGALAAVEAGGGRRRALEDVIWSIFNSAELGAVW